MRLPQTRLGFSYNWHTLDKIARQIVHEKKKCVSWMNKLDNPVLPNLQFGRREYQHLQCEKATISGCSGTTVLQGRL